MVFVESKSDAFGRVFAGFFVLTGICTLGSYLVIANEEHVMVEKIIAIVFYTLGVFYLRWLYLLTVQSGVFPRTFAFDSTGLTVSSRSRVTFSARWSDIRYFSTSDYRLVFMQGGFLHLPYQLLHNISPGKLNTLSGGVLQEKSCLFWPTARGTASRRIINDDSATENSTPSEGTHTFSVPVSSRMLVYSKVLWSGLCFYGVANLFGIVESGNVAFAAMSIVYLLLCARFLYALYREHWLACVYELDGPNLKKVYRHRVRQEINLREVVSIEHPWWSGESPSNTTNKKREGILVLVAFTGLFASFILLWAGPKTVRTFLCDQSGKRMSFPSDTLIPTVTWPCLIAPILRTAGASFLPDHITAVDVFGEQLVNRGELLSRARAYEFFGDPDQYDDA